MKILNVIISMLMFLLTTLSGQCLSAQDIVSDNSRILAVVPLSKGSINKYVYRKFDALVPELKKISRNSIIKLECRYSGRPEREQDVIKAYQYAGSIAKYLRERHKLALDLWITVNLSEQVPKVLPVITIAVFANDIERPNSIQVEPSRNKQDK